MITVTDPRFVLDETGTKVAVVLPIDVYEQLEIGRAHV